ncbi:MAG TPA: hypothetical protein VIB07_04215 [Nitrososphaera sp.]
MGRTSSLAIVSLVFATLFLLLYISTYLRDDAKRLHLESLEVKKTDVTINRINNASPVCFVLAANDLARYGFLPYFIEEADRIAMEDEPNEDGRYDAFGGGANTADVVQFIGDFESKLDLNSKEVTIRGQYTDRIHVYKCNFEYDGRQYDIWFELRSLTAVSDYAGYVPILITENGIVAKLRPAIPQGFGQDVVGTRYVNNPKDLIVYLSFNNTVIWTNTIDNQAFQNSIASISPGLTRLSAGSEPYEVSTRIPAGQSWDYRLRPADSGNGTTYHYAVTLPSGIKHEGNIHVRSYPQCMSQADAQSLYGQNGIDVRYPSYLPDEYRYICGTHITGFSFVQSYWNGSEVDMQRVANETGYDSFEAYATRDVGLQSGVIQMWLFKAERADDSLWNVTAEDRLHDSTILGQQNEPGAQVIEIDPDNRVSAYAHVWHLPSGNINVLEISDPSKGEAYIIRAKLPMEELVRIAQSMFS